MPNAFEKLISAVPQDATVLEVGTAGLEGENTSNAIAARFKKENILGFNSKPVIWDKYTVMQVDFYAPDFAIEPPMQFDLIVLDLNIDHNIGNDWSDAGLASMHSMLKPGGFLINYVMMTDQYGDVPVTPALIKAHMADFWREYPLTNKRVGEKLQQIPGFSLHLAIQEERRPYITWVMLQKK